MCILTHLPVGLGPLVAVVEWYSVLFLLQNVPCTLPFVKLSIEYAQVQQPITKQVVCCAKDQYRLKMRETWST